VPGVEQRANVVSGSEALPESAGWPQADQPTRVTPPDKERASRASQFAAADPDRLTSGPASKSA